MKKLLASLVLASVASSALAVPPSHPQPVLGEAQGAATVRKDVMTQPGLAENGFERTPLGQLFAEDGFDLTPQADRLADDGFERTPLGQLLADDGFERTPLGQLLAEDGSDRAGIGSV
ncbi:hypothetical protein MST27_15950 [Pseudomonas sp. PS1]|uniref:Uncharacterized protein n=1 Tax=Stutzerimonas marianensis TaxID=2929513 RepID=A0A9X1W4H8_9GAMM|nr:hypothetical protein [Pseudomonas marianensis]MCJ0974866.1 hypothetical protein [Pseudomonas marianensis]